MFDTLISSKPKKQRSVGQAVLSLGLHGLIIFAAVKATAGAAEAIKNLTQDTTLVFLEAPKEVPKEAPPPPEAIVSANPPPKGFQTIVPPDAIPTEIPPVNLAERFNPEDFTGKGVEGGIAAGIVGGTGPVLDDQTFLEAQVDDPPQLISAGPRRYPPVLERAKISGRVEFQFIVDTTGRAEPRSFKVLGSSNSAFEEPAREMILKSLFKPGRVRGHPVRVLVQQSVRFDAP